MTTDISSLHNSMLLNVFSFINDPKDVDSISKVSKRWHDLLRQFLDKMEVQFDNTKPLSNNFHSLPDLELRPALAMPSQFQFGKSFTRQLLIRSPGLAPVSVKVKGHHLGIANKSFSSFANIRMSSSNSPQGLEFILAMKNCTAVASKMIVKIQNASCQPLIYSEILIPNLLYKMSFVRIQSEDLPFKEVFKFCWITNFQDKERLVILSRFTLEVCRQKLLT